MGLIWYLAIHSTKFFEIFFARCEDYGAWSRDCAAYPAPQSLLRAPCSTLFINDNPLHGAILILRYRNEVSTLCFFAQIDLADKLT